MLMFLLSQQTVNWSSWSIGMIDLYRIVVRIKRMIYMYASCDWHRRHMYVCYLYLDMDLYCRVPCLLAIPSTDDGRHDKIEYVFYTLPHTKHCILNDHARSTSLTNARVLWNLKIFAILILFQNISIFSVDL